MYVLDSRSPRGGFLPIAHDDWDADGYDEDMRTCLLMVRVQKRIEGIESYVFTAKDNVGDLLGGLLWKKDARPLNGVMFAWPTKIVGGSSCLPVKTSDWELASGDFEKLSPGMHPDHPSWINDYAGIVLSGSETREQHEQFHPTDPRLFAPNRFGADAVDVGSRICDLAGADEGVAMGPWARMQSAWRVIKDPQSGNKQVPPQSTDPVEPGVAFSGNAIAWQLTQSGLSDAYSGGCYDKLADNSIGMPAHIDSGPLWTKCPTGKHRIGEDSDGHPINALHLHLDSYFTDESGAFDGPLKHDGYWQGAIDAPHSHYVFFEFDPAIPHDFVLGRRIGKHRWRAKSHHYTPHNPNETGDPVPRRPPVDTVPLSASRPAISLGNERTADGTVIRAGEGITRDPETGVTRREYGPPARPDATETSTVGIDLFPIPPRTEPSNAGIDSYPIPPPAIFSGADFPVPPDETVFEPPEDWDTIDPSWRPELQGRTEARERHEAEQEARAANANVIIGALSSREWKVPQSATTWEHAAPSWAARPQLIRTDAIDYRLWRDPTESALLQLDRTVPITGRIVAFGKQLGGSEWDYTERPCRGRYPGGTASGGFCVIPPEYDLTEILGPSISTPSYSTTVFGLHSDVVFGWGIPDFSTGTVAGGATFTHSGGTVTFDGTLLLSGLTANRFVYTDGSKNLTTGSNATFDGTDAYFGRHVTLGDAGYLKWTSDSSVHRSGAGMVTITASNYATVSAKLYVVGSVGIGVTPNATAGYCTIADTGHFEFATGDVYWDRLTTNQSTIVSTTMLDLDAAKVVIRDGSAAAPVIQFYNDSDSGVYLIGSNNWAAVAGGTAQTTWSTSGAQIPSLGVGVAPDGNAGNVYANNAVGVGVTPINTAGYMTVADAGRITFASGDAYITRSAAIQLTFTAGDKVIVSNGFQVEGDTLLKGNTWLNATSGVRCILWDDANEKSRWFSATREHCTIFANPGSSYASMNLDGGSNATSITSGPPAMYWANTAAVDNSFAKVYFGDSFVGAACAIMGARITSVANNYGEYHFWTRQASGAATRVIIADDVQFPLADSAARGLNIGSASQPTLHRSAANQLTITASNKVITSAALQVVGDLQTDAGRIVAQNILIGGGTVTLTSAYHHVLSDTDTAAGGAMTVDLPASPDDGREYIVKNIGSDGNDLTIGRNGKNINGAASDITLVDGASCWIVYHGASEQWHTYLAE